MFKREKIPYPTVERLPVYYHVLSELKEDNVGIVSSGDMAVRAGVKASQFRKDLSYFGEFGIQGLGYPVAHLIEKIADIMQLNVDHDCALFGCGNLGRAIAGYSGLSRWNFHITRIFDNSPEKIGGKFGGVIVEDVSILPRNLNVSIGILAVPAVSAVNTAQLMVECGIKAILNFTSRNLDPGHGIAVRNVEVTQELAVLAYHIARNF